MNQTEALKILKTGANVFLTGEPGSGKTHLINQYVSYLRSHGITPAITASTGIAATHIGGMTIHSWSGIGIKSRLGKGDLHSIATNDYILKRVGAAEVLIIDEISMLPPETLGMIDAICREVKKVSKPFGGIQIVLVGDFFQLPPVVRRTFDEHSQEILFDESPIRFAYDAPVWQEAEFVTCYLSEQYRQDDPDLSWVLSKIRGNCFDQLSLGHIQKRKTSMLEVPVAAPKLYSHNVDVDLVNEAMLAKIPEPARQFSMLTKGKRTLIESMKKGCLSPEYLFLKKGAAVMFTKNNQKEGFVNGTLGVVVDFDDVRVLPIIKIRNGRKITVAPADWTVEENGVVRGRLTQIPLRLAWAITVHKSQGISLDEAVIDLSKVFEFGQGYVAISRVKRLTGIFILGWNNMAFRVDPEVLKKDNDFRLESASTENMFGRLPQKELHKMYDDFILKCDGKLKPAEIDLKIIQTKVSTYDETFRLWQEGNDVQQIAKSRDLNRGTILSHLEKLAGIGKINRADFVKIIPASLKDDLPKIQTAFKNLETDKLSPVFEYFHGEYSYDDLRLVRMLA